MNKGYYNEKTLDKFAIALKSYAIRIKNGEEFHVSISNANSKMGNVASVSLLPFVTCPNCCKDSCGSKCYAAKLANLRPNVLESYAKNTALCLYKPNQYWEEVNNACKGVRFFRFHVSGDIINKAYFHHMVDIANNNSHCEILCFTKRFDAVNSWIENGNEIPANLHIMFSGWTNLKPENPYNMPETNVIEKGSEPRNNWTVCGGNCYECACNCAGCWGAKKGDTIAFHIH